MKRKILFVLFAAFGFTGLCLAQCQSNCKKDDIKKVSDNLRFCEGSVKYGNSILVSNFGGEKINSTNQDGKGYIVKIENGKSEVFIPSDGTLSAPKGMAISDNHLYIADLFRVVVYNLSNLKAKAQIIEMPENERFLNDVEVLGNKAYISVTNTGNIYSLDITNPDKLSPNDLSLFANITGANGLAADNKSIYVASFPSNGNPTNQNIIYRIDNVESPNVVKVTDKKGSYDGIAIDGDNLYFTDWINMELDCMNLKTKVIKKICTGDNKITGPADICINNHVLFLPNLPSSEIIEIPIE